MTRRRTTGSHHRLEDQPLFAGIPPRKLRDGARGIEFFVAHHDTVLLANGKRALEMFVVVSGSVLEHSDHGLVDRYSAGRWTNPLPVLAKQRSDHTLTATEGSELLVVGYRELATILDVIPGVGRRLLTRLASENEVIPAFPPRAELPHGLRSRTA